MTDPNPRLNEWQTALRSRILAWDRLSFQPIIWYTGRGNDGKTWMSQYIVQKLNGLQFKGVHIDQIAFYWTTQRILVFDLCSQLTQQQYDILKDLQCGQICDELNNKKISKNIPMIIVLSNTTPLSDALNYIDYKQLNGSYFDVGHSDSNRVIYSDAEDIPDLKPHFTFGEIRTLTPIQQITVPKQTIVNQSPVQTVQKPDEFLLVPTVEDVTDQTDKTEDIFNDQLPDNIVDTTTDEEMAQMIQDMEDNSKTKSQSVADLYISQMKKSSAVTFDDDYGNNWDNDYGDFGMNTPHLKSTYGDYSVSYKNSDKYSTSYNTSYSTSSYKNTYQPSVSGYSKYYKPTPANVSPYLDDDDKEEEIKSINDRLDVLHDCVKSIEQTTTDMFDRSLPTADLIEELNVTQKNDSMLLFSAFDKQNIHINSIDTRLRNVETNQAALEVLLKKVLTAVNAIDFRSRANDD